jgi:Spy/CpxP family protein refolding chaperone
MNQIRLFAIGTLMMFALTAGAQQTAGAPTGVEKENHSSTQNSTDPVESHLKKLSEQLSLTSNQESQVRPILQEMHDTMGNAEKNQSLSDDERKAQMHAAFMKADGQIREVLTDDQKKTLDQLEQQMHPGMHESANGATKQ